MKTQLLKFAYKVDDQAYCTIQRQVYEQFTTLLKPNLMHASGTMFNLKMILFRNHLIADCILEYMFTPNLCNEYKSIKKCNTIKNNYQRSRRDQQLGF